MSDIMFKVLELAVMLCAAVITRYLVPYIRQSIGSDKLDAAYAWVKNAVLFAQQTMWADTGQRRKKYVVEFITDLCARHDIPLTPQQIDILIEAAVKEMKIEDAKGQTIKIEAAIKDEQSEEGA